MMAGKLVSNDDLMRAAEEKGPSNRQQLRLME